MHDIIKLLDEELRYIGHEISLDTIFIKVASERKESICPNCGQVSRSVHSRTTRTLQDLPIQGKKVKILLDQNKYFCKNKECKNKTFAERFSFYTPKATKTNRLQNEIIKVALTQSSVAASRYLRSSVADAGKSTICNLLKKGLKKQLG